MIHPKLRNVRITTLMQRCSLRLLILLLAATQAGCSARAWYAGLQESAKNQCARRPPAADEDCRQRLPPQRFDDYEKAREQIRP